MDMLLRGWTPDQLSWKLTNNVEENCRHLQEWCERLSAEVEKEDEPETGEQPTTTGTKLAK